jgi:NAD(P)-dependent dehydrogenase (short-subunit alcohol dehydrogenase family)
MKNIIVITGASSGFGALAARALAIAGHTVYASMRETTGRNARQVEAAQQFAAENGVDLRTIELDVASQESADQAIKTIVEKDGRLDVVIHNAGPCQVSAILWPLFPVGDCAWLCEAKTDKAIAARINHPATLSNGFRTSSLRAMRSGMLQGF